MSFYPQPNFFSAKRSTEKALQLSPNEDINKLWTETSNYKNIQYHTYKNTKDVLSTIRKQHKDKIKHQLISQGSFLCNVIKYSIHDPIQLNIWSDVHEAIFEEN